MLSVRDVIEKTVDYVVKNSVYKGLTIKQKAKEFANIPQYKGNKFLYPSIDIRNSSVDTSLWFCSDAIEIFSDNKLLFEKKLKVFFGKQRVKIQKRNGSAIVVKFDKVKCKKSFLNDSKNLNDNIILLGKQFIEMMDLCDDLIERLGVYKSYNEIEEQIEENVTRLNGEWSDKKQKAFLKGNIGDEPPEQETVQIIRYKRDPAVVVAARWRANGYCEECKKPAPFNRQTDGAPFLEVHHIHPLSQGGVDKIYNVKAICPNCHRKLHYGNG